MALISGFEYDIFISYAHVDNHTISSQKNGWILKFYEHLKQMLDRRYGRMDVLKIWWDDKKLDGTKLFDDSIRDGIEKSALLICLNSPGYTQSRYCRQELDLFHQKCGNEKPGLKVGDRSRIVHILLNNIAYEEWPDELSGTTGFPFHDARERDDFGDPTDIGSKKFINQMRDLRDALWGLISEFRGIKENGQTELAGGEKKYTIFMGEVPDTLRSHRTRVTTELVKKGYHIISGIPPPLEANAHKKTVDEAMQKADMAVHLLDMYPGREIIGDTKNWYPQKQTEICLDLPKPQMIWMPSTLDSGTIEEEAYRNFVRQLETGNRTKKDYEFVQSSKSTLTQEIDDFAQQLIAAKTPQNRNGALLPVLLDTHIHDQSYAFDLGKVLLEHQIQPFINPQEDDPRKNISLLGDRMGMVKKMIFLYGKVSKEWVLERMSAALQLIITRNYPVEDFFVYMAPPNKKAEDLSLRQKFLKINVVDNSHDQVLNESVIDKFMADLKSGAV
jgi:hypothetical protein